MGKGNNNEQTSQVKADPWGPVQPFLKQGFADLSTQYGKGAPGYYPGQTVADMSGYTQGSLDSMAARASAGSPLMQGANSQLMKTLNGDYLDPNSNPGFQGALSAAIRPLTDAFTGSVMPGIDSNFSAAGRYGSGAQMGAYNDANDSLARGIGDVSSNMAYNNYANERGNQMTAMGMAPGMANQDYKDISMLGLAGAGYDMYNQSLLDADKQKYDFNANKDMQWLQNYIGTLGGAPPPSQTTNTKTPAPSPWASALGLGLQGASMLGGGLFGGGGAGAIWNPTMAGGVY